ncbi:MAG: cytochrome c oxidase subunit 3 family protein [Bradyrhizobium sp.]|nr:cytochrome c oxidase subunit 3 family protein [Bradyrhizobium sp.]
MPEAKAFASQFVSTHHRDDAAELGMWVFIATEVLLFGSLILGYFVYRHVYPAAFAPTLSSARQIPQFCLPPAFSWLAPSTPSPPRRGRYASCCYPAPSCWDWLSLFKAIEYSDEYREHLVPGIDFSFDAAHGNGAQLFFMFYFVATAIHALHMLVGIGLLAVLAVLTYRAPSTRHGAALHSTALYWHFVDVVWIFLFALIYLPGRSS